MTRTRILEYVRQYTTDHGLPPTVQEITDGLGLSTTSLAYYHLRKLTAGGELVERPFNERRYWPAEHSTDILGRAMLWITRS